MVTHYVTMVTQSTTKKEKTLHNNKLCFYFLNQISFEFFISIKPPEIFHLFHQYWGNWKIKSLNKDLSIFLYIKIKRQDIFKNYFANYALSRNSPKEDTLEHPRNTFAEIIFLNTFCHLIGCKLVNNKRILVVLLKILPHKPFEG